MRNVFISSAARGLGLEILKLHLEMGDRVFACYHTMTDELQALCGGNMTAAQLDISDPESVSKAADAVISECEKLDIIYHVAGTMRDDANMPFENLDIEAMGPIIDTNGVGFLRVTQKLWNLIGEGTTVCCISSTSGSMRRRYERPLSPDVQQIPFSYAMSKAAMNMGGILLEKQLKLKGARLFLVQPGVMRTKLSGWAGTVDPCDSAKGITQMAIGKKDVPFIFVDYKGDEMPL